MRYRPTLGNVISAALLVICIWHILFYEEEPGASLGALYPYVIAIMSLIGLVLDFGLQQLIKNYWRLNAVEVGVLIILYFWGA